MTRAQALYVMSTKYMGPPGPCASCGDATPTPIDHCWYFALANRDRLDPPPDDAWEPAKEAARMVADFDLANAVIVVDGNHRGLDITMATVVPFPGACGYLSVAERAA